MKLELRKFNPVNIKHDAVCIWIGKRRTGKSFSLKNCLYHLRSFPTGVVISPTEMANTFFSKFIPNVLLYDEYEPGILERFVERQKKITMQYKREISMYGRSDIDPRAFLILDDCMYDNKNWVNDRSIRYLFMNGRHIYVFFAITMQYALGIPPALRSNVDYVFIARENNIANREKLYKQFAGMFPSFDVFCQVMDQTTQNYEQLVIDNTITESNHINDQVFWFKADNVDFKMCLPQLWEMQKIEDARRQMGIADEEQEDPYDPNVFSRKRNAPNLRVHKAYT
jgi:hypothetical protein